ncbi:chloride channel protein [Candidatus Thorarchaeota archaeon]|nr:MAG: chloride channel protein [Candidatus Thorarchaeota archaeon]
MSSRQQDAGKGEPIQSLRELFHFAHFTEFYRLYIPAAILIGVICGFFMVAFQALIDLSIIAFSVLPTYIAPLLGGLFSAVLIYAGAREIEGSGISKAIELTHNPSHLHPRTAVTKMVATSVSIGTGNPVGREGPAVLIGAAVGNFLGRRLGYSEDAHLRVFLMMGSAACTAGIYKAPLGGALFASESPYRRDARLGYFVPFTLSAIASYLTFTLIMGLRPILDFETAFDFTMLHVPFLIIFGLVCAGVSVLFSISLMSTRNLFRRRLPDWADPIVGSLLACLIIFVTGAFLNPELTVAGLGYEVISYVASTNVPMFAILLLLFGKLFGSSFVVGGRISGGVLASSLFVGAMLGSAFGMIFFPQDIPTFMFLGMGSVLAATTNTPVATTVLLLEISHSFDLLIPLIICICVAYLASGGSSLYEGQKVTRDDEDPGFYASINVGPSDKDGVPESVRHEGVTLEKPE